MEDLNLNTAGKDDLAENWAAMVESDTPELNPDRLLNQDEIDSLLGLGTENQSKPQGLKLLLDSKTISYERLPMLEVVFDRLVRLLSTTLRNLMSENVEVSLKSITSVRFGDYINSIPLPSIIGVVKAEEWDNSVLISADTSLTYSVVDVLLGGRRGTIGKFEGRSFTTLEQNLIERLFKIVLNDTSKSFTPLADVNFKLERMETNPRFASIVRPTNAAIRIKLRLEMEERGGDLEFVFPYATLEPIRDQLLQMFMGEKFGQDTIWENHLGNEIWDTQIELQAIIDQVPLTLEDVMSWTVGSQIMLKSRPDSQIMLKCGDTYVMNGHMGQRNGNIAIQVEKNEIQGKQIL